MPNELLNLLKPIPPQVTNEGAAYGPIQLTEFIQTPGENTRFSASLASGKPLPAGLICTSDGILAGIPAQRTHGTYTIVITVEDGVGEPLITQFELTINQRIVIDEHALFTQLKTQVWEALGKNLPAPELLEFLNRPMTSIEIYYLLERFATLTIWDAYNFEQAGEKKLLNLPDASPHYHIYDRGSCLIAAPKDLFSHERTLGDAFQTAKALAGEVYRRGWTIELAGFHKMVAIAWVEIQLLGEKHGKTLEVLHYSPSVEEVKIYSTQMRNRAFGV